MFEANFSVPGTNGISPDYRNAELTEATWTLFFQRKSTTDPVIVSWDPSKLPPADQYSFRLKDPYGGLLGIDVDMYAQPQLVVTQPAVNSLQIVMGPAGPACEFTYELPAGWSMISLPCAVADNRLQTLFPTAISLFRFANGYQTSQTLEPAVGYWINLPAATTSTITGDAIDPQLLVVSVPQGWSMVGPGNAVVQVSGLGANVISVFGFANGYQSRQTMDPGSGYWVNMAAAGQLDLRGGGTAKPVAQQAEADPQLGRLWLGSGATGQTLYLGGPTAVELPPLPPAGVLDVRALVHGVGTLTVPDGAEAAVYPLRLQGEVSEVRWQLPAAQEGRWQLVVDDVAVPLAAEGVYRLTAGQQVAVRRVGALPAAYALAAAYPNPFNPSTTIGYALPEACSVRLTVYGVTGQVVRCLVDEPQPAGQYRMSWDGTDAEGRPVANGVYLYELRAGQFRAVQRMALVK